MTRYMGHRLGGLGVRNYVGFIFQGHAQGPLREHGGTLQENEPDRRRNTSEVSQKSKFHRHVIMFFEEKNEI